MKEEETANDTGTSFCTLRRRQNFGGETRILRLESTMTVAPHRALTLRNDIKVTRLLK